MESMIEKNVIMYFIKCAFYTRVMRLTKPTFIRLGRVC